MKFKKVDSAPPKPVVTETSLTKRPMPDTSRVRPLNDSPPIRPETYVPPPIDPVAVANTGANRKKAAALARLPALIAAEPTRLLYNPVTGRRVRRPRAFIDKPIAVVNGKKIFGYNSAGTPVCNSRRQGKGSGRCQSQFTFPNGRCKKHGGMNLSGLAHPNAKHLRTSDSLPTGLQEAMRKAELDPNLLSMAHEIQIKDVHINLVKPMLDAGLDEAAWVKLKRFAKNLPVLIETDSKTNLSQKFKDALNSLIDLIEKGSGELSAWKMFDAAVKVRKDLIETESRRQVMNRALMGGRQAEALVVATASVSKEEIAKYILAVERRYTFLDKDMTDKAMELPVGFATFMTKNGYILVDKQRVRSKIDPNYKNDAWTNIGMKLMALISKNNNKNNVEPTDIDQDILDPDIVDG